MKLVVTGSEVQAIKNLCTKNVLVAGTLLSNLDETYFHNKYTKDIYKRIVALNRKTGELPLWSEILSDPAIKEDYREKVKEFDVEKIKSPEAARNLANLLNQYRQLRGSFKLAEEITETLKQKSIGVEDLLDKVSKDLVALRQNRGETSSVTTFGVGNNSTKLVKSLLDEETKNYIPTGISSFDNENGGIGWGNLFVIGGTSGGGKSALAAQLGLNWSDMGENVTMASLEMSAEEMTARIMANAAEIDVRKILFRKLSKEEKVKYWESYKKLVKKKKKNEGSFNIFKPKQDMSIEDITASTFPLNSRILIIDYISLLKGVDGDDAWQKLGAVARYCKVYAESKNMIVVLLCQVSDEGKIRYAQAIKEHANYAWTFVSTKTTRENEILNIEQLKARNGRMFDFSLRARLDVMRITDLEPSEEMTAKDVKPKKKKDAYVSDLTDEE